MPDPSTKSAHILVVDDERHVLEPVQFLLDDAGYQVTASLTPRVLDTLLTAPASVDLIMLDVLLGGIDGRDLARKLKAQPETRAIPILMFSAHPDVHASAIAAGADAFLAKPFNITGLLHTIKRLLAQTS